MWTSKGNFGLFRSWMVSEAVGMREITQMGTYRGRPLPKKLRRNNQVGRENLRPQSIRKEGGRKCQESDRNTSVAGRARRAGLESALWIGRRVTGTSGVRTVTVKPTVSSGLRNKRDT